MRKSAIAFAPLAILVVLAGCNTTRGVGQDVKSVGTEVEKAAEKAK